MIHRPLQHRARLGLTTSLALLTLTGFALAQPKKPPHLGYAYPAGGQQGKTVTLDVGGQYLQNTSQAMISGKGIRTQIVGYKRELSRGQMNQLRNIFNEMRKARREAKKAKKPFSTKPFEEKFRKEMKKRKVQNPEVTFETFMAYRQLRFDPKRQPNIQLSEIVTVQLTIAPGALPGLRELRLQTRKGVSNPIYIQVGQAREIREIAPKLSASPVGRRKPVAPKPVAPALIETLPVTINGQILPGEVDQFRFRAKKGTRLIAAASARTLVPYLADAVPGWFQATLRLLDAKGNEVAYTDDFRFHPDPVFCYDVPADGEYRIEIKDAIYRGREDFVYRILLGEVPYITSIFPIGGQAGKRTTIELEGWNLPARTLNVSPGKVNDGTVTVTARKGRLVSNAVLFGVDPITSVREKEPNASLLKAQQLAMPVVVDGRIGATGDEDFFAFAGKEGEEIVAEVFARRLGSPMDSLLTLTGPDGKALAANDDCVDKSVGLITHQADSRLEYTLPKAGTYFLTLSDTQNQGGNAFAYRLRVRRRKPDFALRVTPSTLTSEPGQNALVTVHALRKDGFAGPIHLTLANAPKGFSLSGGWIPAGQDKAQMTLTCPPRPQPSPENLTLVGQAKIGKKLVRRQAVPAEDQMQAFLYRHLVPTEKFLVSVLGRKHGGPGMRWDGSNIRTLVIGKPLRVFLDPAYRSAYVAKEFHLNLKDPPKGVTVDEKFRLDERGLSVLITADPKVVKPGWEGNLIFSTYTEWHRKAKNGKRARSGRTVRPPLPALPIKIVAGGE